MIRRLKVRSPIWRLTGHSLDGKPIVQSETSLVPLEADSDVLAIGAPFQAMTESGTLMQMQEINFVRDRAVYRHRCVRAEALSVERPPGH